jgi:hypothetical protein
MTPAETLSSLVQTAAPGELPALAAELARASALVMARIATVAATTIAPSPRPADELITVEEAAALLNVKVSWLYRHWRELGCGRKIGRRTLRFERRGVERWAANRPRR